MVGPPADLPRLPFPTSSSTGSLNAPPPPARGGELEASELKLMHEIAAHRTPDGDAWARYLDKAGRFAAWVELAKLYRDHVGLIQGWFGTALLGSTLVENALLSTMLKRHFRRKRPYVADPTLRPLFEEASQSYPSGHASTAFAAARIISKLDPTLAEVAYGLANQVALSRVYAGVHFPSDVVMGATLGTAVADRMWNRFHHG
jgi:membrane-associated phospholipid phosphatase